MGTGAMGANLYLYGSTLAAILDKHAEYGVKISVQATGGLEENLNRVASGQIQLGLVSGPEAGMAYRGEADWAGKEEYKHIKALLSFPYAGAQAVTLAEKPIYTLSDLKGKSIAIGAPGSSGAKYFWPAILEEHGITKDNAKLLTLGTTQASEAMERGTLDVRTALGLPPIPSITELAMAKPIRLVSMDRAAVERFVAKRPGYYAVNLPKDAYPNQKNTEGVLTVGFNAVLVAHDSVSEDVIYQITKAWWTNVAEFGKAHEQAKKWDVAKALEGISLPLAEGAKKYYREVGVLK
jgi:TRAP transporter TAXI family solute receptor